jgi:hypothetical protein
MSELRSNALLFNETRVATRPLLVPRLIHCSRNRTPRTPGAELHGLLRPYPAETMTTMPVGRYVNNPRNKAPQCMAS